MLRILFVFLFIVSPAMAAEEKLACDIEIEFNSTDSGIDSTVYANIMKRVVQTPTITEKHIENVGAGGERTLCLTVKPEELTTVYEDLKTLIPEEGRPTWTRISARDGREFKTQPYKKFVRNYDWR